MKGDRVKLTFPIVERTVKTKLGGRLYTLVIKGNEVVSIDPPGKHYPYYQRDHYRENKARWVNRERFVGPFVFHCHNLEHEDMRMMHVFDPRPAGEPSLNDGRRPHSSTVSVDGVASYSEVSGMVQDEQREPVGFGPVFFEREGDEELLNDRNVGFPATDFPRPPAGQILPGPPGEDAPDNHDD